MAEQDARTEPASARRLQRARDDGDVALSREAAPLAALAAFAGLLSVQGDRITADFARALQAMLWQPPGTAGTAFGAAAIATARAVAPLALAVLLAVAASVLAQTGLLLKPQALLPDFGRLDPRRGLSRVLGPVVLLEAGKSLAKLGLIGAAAWSALPQPGRLASAMAWPAALLLRNIGAAVGRVALAVIAMQALIAAADVAWTRWKHARRLRMSRQELKDEAREAEGDPAIKRRIRQIGVQRARRRMIQAVPKATVVVVNPTHYAVALAYARGGGGAPRVVAKGMDSLAARIREAAVEHRVPVVTNPPLARALWRVELDAEIPPDLFQAVAEILSFLWRLRPPQPGPGARQA